MYCYFSMHFNDISGNRKLRSLLNLKTLKLYTPCRLSYSKFQGQLSRVTEWLVSNIAARILIWTHKFWTANKTLSPLCIFVSRNPWHPFAEPSWRNTVLREYIVWMFLRLQCWVVCRGLREEATGGWGKCIPKRFINYSYYRLVGCDTLCFGNETYCRHFEGWSQSSW